MKKLMEKKGFEFFYYVKLDGLKGVFVFTIKHGMDFLTVATKKIPENEKLEFIKLQGQPCIYTQTETEGTKILSKFHGKTITAFSIPVDAQKKLIAEAKKFNKSAKKIRKNIRAQIERWESSCESCELTIGQYPEGITVKNKQLRIDTKKVSKVSLVALLYQQFLEKSYCGNAVTNLDETTTFLRDLYKKYHFKLEWEDTKESESVINMVQYNFIDSFRDLETGSKTAILNIWTLIENNFGVKKVYKLVGKFKVTVRSWKPKNDFKKQLEIILKKCSADVDPITLKKNTIKSLKEINRELRVFVDYLPVSYTKTIWDGGDADNVIVYALLDEGKEVLWCYESDDWTKFIIRPPVYQEGFNGSYVYPSCVRKSKYVRFGNETILF